MANTNKLSNTQSWVEAFLVQRPTTGVGGTANEPFLTAANMMMQTILGPPFRWEWNRAINSSIQTIAGTADYKIVLPDFGWLEKATLLNANAPMGITPNFELEVSEVKALEGKQNRPQFIAVSLDDNGGNITFRLMPVPDQTYSVELIYQKSPIQATNLTGSWAPIPDKFAYLYERGMLAQMQMMYNQQIAAMNLEIFFRQLVAAAEGLSEMQKAIFLEEQLRIAVNRISAVTGVQQGKQARS